MYVPMDYEMLDEFEDISVDKTVVLICVLLAQELLLFCKTI